MKKYFASLLIVLSIGILGIFIFSNKDQTHKLRQVTLGLEWFLNTHHAPLVIGLEKGFFREEGIELQLLPPSAGDEGVKLVAMGKADFAISGQPRHIIHVSKGMPLTRVATMMDHSLEGIATMGKNSPIKSLADLKGKKIGHASTGSGFTMIALKAMLQKHGVNPDSVTFIQVGQGIATSLLSGRVDAVANVLQTYEFMDIQRFNPNAELYTHGKAGIPEYDSIIVVANSQKLDKDLVTRFVRALKKSSEYMKSAPAEETWTIFIKNKPELDTPINKKSWPLVIQHFSATPEYLDKKRYTEFSQFLKDWKALKGDLPPIDQYVYEAKLS